MAISHADVPVGEIWYPCRIAMTLTLPALVCFTWDTEAQRDRHPPGKAQRALD